MNWAGLWLTFQAGFTESFMASSVVVSVALSRGRKNAVLGTLIGLTAAGLLAFLLQAFLLRIPTTILHWVSSVLLLAFGAFLLREFVKGRGRRLLEFTKDGDAHAWSASAVTVAAWGVFNEGLEILAVWLAIALQDGPVTATLGASVGIALVRLRPSPNARPFLPDCACFADYKHRIIVANEAMGMSPGHRWPVPGLTDRESSDRRCRWDGATS